MQTRPYWEGGVTVSSYSINMQNLKVGTIVLTSFANFPLFKKIFTKEAVKF